MLKIGDLVKVDANFAFGKLYGYSSRKIVGDHNCIRRFAVRDEFVIILGSFIDDKKVLVYKALNQRAELFCFYSGEI